MSIRIERHEFVTDCLQFVQVESSMDGICLIVEETQSEKPQIRLYLNLDEARELIEALSRTIDHQNNIARNRKK